MQHIIGFVGNDAAQLASTLLNKTSLTTNFHFRTRTENCIIITYLSSADDSNEYRLNEKERSFTVGKIYPKEQCKSDSNLEYSDAFDSDGCFVAGKLQNGTPLFSLCTDPFGLYPLYYYTNKGGLTFSSSLDIVIKCRDENLTLDLTGVAQFCHFHHYLGETTLCKEIRRFPRGKGLAINTETNKIEWVTQFDWPKIEKHQIEDMDEAVTLLKKAFEKSIMKRAKGQEELISLLSAGFDSRLIVSILKNMGLNFSSFTTYGDQGDYTDPKGAELVSEILGISNLFIELPPDYLERHWRNKSDIINHETTMHSWLMPLTTHLPKSSTNFDGLGGDKLITSPYPMGKNALGLIDDKDWGGLKRVVFDWFWPGQSFKRMFQEEYQDKLSELLLNSYESEFELLDKGPNMHAQFILNNRTRRGIGCAPVSLLSDGFNSTMPFMDRSFVELCFQISNSLKFDGKLYRKLLNNISPQLSDIPSSHDSEWPSDIQVKEEKRYWTNFPEPINSYLKEIEKLPEPIRKFIDNDWLNDVNKAKDSNPNERAWYIREAQALGEICYFLTKYSEFFHQKLPKEVYEMIEERVPTGGSIIAFGSAAISGPLSESFNIVIIDDNPQCLETHGDISILAPIEPNIRSNSVDESGWYNEEKVRSAFSEEWIDLLLIDGPSNEIGKTGILAFPDLIWKANAILVTDVDQPVEHSLALSIAAEVQGTITIHTSKKCNDNRPNKSWAWIVPTEISLIPTTVNYPNITGILPESLTLEKPKGVANDHGWITAKVTQHYLSWTPSIPISIVIPLYNRKEMLGRTLYALTHQTYPLDLIQIVIADDGSDDHPEDVFSTFEDYFEIVHVRQNDLGYRLSEIRNLGIRASKYENIILLDCDMAPVPRFVETYARHLSVTTKAVYCGHRRYVDANSIPFTDLAESISPLLGLPDIETANVQVKGKQRGPTIDWRLPMYQSSDNLRWEKHPFRATCGGNIAFHKSVLEKAGWFDEEFTAWGAEDTEWGFRVWNSGHYIMPLLEACGLHQEPPGGRNETDREAGRAISHPMLIDKCPVVYRGIENGIGHSVPLVSIYMPAYNVEGTILDAVKSALNQTFEDLEICIVDDGSTDSTFNIIMTNFSDDKRVRIKRTENRGIGSASNEAIRMTRGVYIGQLDADDLLQPDAVESMLKVIRRNTQLGVVYGSYQKIDPSGKLISDGYVWQDYSREKLLSAMMIHHFRLFRARDWWRTDGFDESLTNAVDYEMFLKLSEVTEFEHLHKWTYLYRIHSESTSVANKSVQDINNLVVINRALKRRNLHRDWIAECKDKSNPRKVTFRRVSSANLSRKETTKLVENESVEKDNKKIRKTKIGTIPKEIYRLKIGPFNQLNEFLRARRRLKMFRWFWSFHTMAENPGLKPSLSLVSGRLDEERAEKELKRFQKKFKSWKIEIVRTER